MGKLISGGFGRQGYGRRWPLREVVGGGLFVTVGVQVEILGYGHRPQLLPMVVNRLPEEVWIPNCSAQQDCGHRLLLLAEDHPSLSDGHC